MQIKAYTANAMGKQYARGVQFKHNGLTLSLALGPGSYSDGSSPGYAPSEADVQHVFNSTAEIAVINEATGEFAEIGNDNVIGWVKIDILPQLLTLLYTPASVEKRTAALVELLLG